MAATIDKKSNCDHLEEEEGKTKKPEDQLNTCSWKEKHKQTDGTVAQQQNLSNINAAITNATDTEMVQGDNNGEDGNLVSIKSGRTTQKEEQLQSFYGGTHSDEMGDKTDEKRKLEDDSANEKPSKDGDVTICSSHDHLIEKEKGEATISSHDKLTKEQKNEGTSDSHDNLTDEKQGESTSSSHDIFNEEDKDDAKSSSQDNLSEEENGEAISSFQNNLTEEEKGEAISSSHDNLTEEDKGDVISSSQNNLTEEEKGEAISLHDAFAQTDVTPRMPDNLPAEESNFLRFCHLIQKVAPQAVRHRFDQVFPPADLEGIIQRNKAALKNLYQNRVITHPQWKLICPSGIAPSSLTFDLTAMICLFRHLTKTSPKNGLYDTLPPSSDTSLGADLARIKYFRNNIAHYLEKDRKIDNKDFPVVWDTASMAISRTGGTLYQQECSNLRTANLDSSYMDIYREFLVKEMDLQQKVSGLTQSHQQLHTEYGKKITEITESHQQLQNEHEHDKKEIEKLQTKFKDSVPEHERENIKFITDKWEANKHLFIETSAATHLKKIIKAENVAIVTGSPGSGKTFTVQNVLLSMREEGYDVIPVRSSSDLVRYFSRSARQVFFLDNLCGKHNISNSDIEEWDRNRDTLVEMFTNSSTKSFFICRLQIFLDPKFQNLKLKEYKVINLSGDQQLTLDEKQSIGQIHIGKSIMEQLTDQAIMNCLCFPLLCSLYDKQSMNTTAYFEKPKQFFETELTELRERPDKTKYGCIALCVLLNNKVGLNFFSSTNEEGKTTARAVFEELGVNVPPMKAIQSCFDSMEGSLFQKTSENVLLHLAGLKPRTGYKSIHDYLFDIYCTHVSKTMIETIILYGDSGLIRDRAFLQSIGEHNENAIVVPVEFEQVYFERISKDLYSFRVSDVFGNSQMKYESYRSKFMKFLDLIYFDVNIRDKYCITPIHKSSEAGYVDVVEMLCNKGADLNPSDEFGSTPLTTASKEGHVDVVELLCNKGADVNPSGEFGWTPLTAASENGHIDVVKELCNKGAHVNLCGQFGLSALTGASFGGHIDVVELLCNKGADVNIRANNESTPLTAASKQGHIDVVELLWNKGADINLSDKDGWTPLTVASFRGHIDVVELLCNKGADLNLSGYDGSTPLMAASREGHIDVVELLCNKRADVNLSGMYGSTPLTASSGEGHIDVVKLLCNKGADVNLGKNFRTTPLTAASERGHIDVVQLLCNKGADVNLRCEYGLTPLKAASLCRHPNVVELLRKKGATEVQYQEFCSC